MSKGIDDQDLKDTTKAVLKVIQELREESLDYRDIIDQVIKKVGYENILRKLEKNPDKVVSGLEIIYNATAEYTNIVVDEDGQSSNSEKLEQSVDNLIGYGENNDADSGNDWSLNHEN